MIFGFQFVVQFVFSESVLYVLVPKIDSKDVQQQSIRVATVSGSGKGLRLTLGNPKAYLTF